METDRLLGGSVDAASEDYGSYSGSEHAGTTGTTGRRRKSHSVTEEYCTIERGPGEWERRSKYETKAEKKTK